MNLFSCIFQIHDGPNSTSPAFLEQPRYDGGSWTRPVIAATSKYVFLKFIPGPTKGKTFVGFKASYWTVQSKYIEMYTCINLIRYTQILYHEKSMLSKREGDSCTMFNFSWRFDFSTCNCCCRRCMKASSTGHIAL